MTILESVRNKSDEELLDYLAKICVVANRYGLRDTYITQEQVRAYFSSKVPKLKAGDIVEACINNSIQKVVMTEDGYAVSMNGGLIIYPACFNSNLDLVRAVYRFNKDKKKLEKIWFKE